MRFTRVLCVWELFWSIIFINFNFSGHQDKVCAESEVITDLKKFADFAPNLGFKDLCSSPGS